MESSLVLPRSGSSPSTACPEGALDAGLRAALRAHRRDRGAVPDPPPCPDSDPEDARRRLETDLMLLFRDTGLPAAFEALYESSRSVLYAWILHMLAARRQPGDPLELLQDTFVNVYRYAHSFREGAGQASRGGGFRGGFRGWARTVAANAVRRAARRPVLPVSDLGENAPEPEDCRPRPDRLASTSEETRRLQRAWALLLLLYARAWAELSPRDREALHLVEVEGLTYREAGRRLRVGRSNMKMIMFRCRRRVRSHVLRAMSPGPALLRAAG